MPAPSSPANRSLGKPSLRFSPHAVAASYMRVRTRARREVLARMHAHVRIYTWFARGRGQGGDTGRGADGSWTEPRL